ncbi:hypothetical protein BJ944DRAFT_265869 [Cunninghamella echinulata]|nr:hypothetical protein BJ944DRAFT_265869 [Cunninghamella echinulata]
MLNTKRKSCLKNKNHNNNNYCQHRNKQYHAVQFFDECIMEDVSSPESLKDIYSPYIYTIHNDEVDGTMASQNKYISQDQMFQKLYQKEKTKTRLLQSKIQYLENELNEKNHQLQKSETNTQQCMKLSSLINDILYISSNSDNNECSPTIDSIYDHLQIVLSNVMSISNQNKIDDFY